MDTSKNALFARWPRQGCARSVTCFSIGSVRCTQSFLARAQKLQFLEAP